MSYDISIKYRDTDETVTIPEKHNLAGGTFQIGGTNELWLNITSNYSPIFRRVFGKEGIHVLTGMKIQDSIPILEKAIKELGDAVPSSDYWEECDGNAKLALSKLKNLAELALLYNPKEEMTWANDY